MAFGLPLFTGFYHRSTGIFGTGNSSGASVVADQTGFADWCLQLPNTVSSTWFKVYIEAGHTELYVAFHYASSTTDGDEFIACRVYMTDGKIIDFRNSIYGPWLAYVDGGLVATGPINHGGEGCHVEMRFDIADAGHLQLWVDGILEIDYSGDTKPSAATDILYFMGTGTTNSHASYIANLYIRATRCYERIVEGSTVDADAVPNDWDTSAGADHYAMVDEAPPDDATTYLQTGVDGEQELFEHPALTMSNLTTFEVMIWARAQKTSALATLQYKLLLESNATQSLSAAFDVYQTWLYNNFYLAQDPDGPQAWDLAAINAATFGVESEIT